MMIRNLSPMPSELSKIVALVAFALTHVLILGCGAQRSSGVAHGGTAGAAGASFDVKTFLARSVPSSQGEGLPHGVPESWDWATHATTPTLSPPADTGWMNWWGQIYVDTTDVRPANTRVEVLHGKLLLLYQGASAFTTYQATDELGGGAWTEDFTQSGGPFDMKTEPDGGRSFTNSAGYNAHFWPNVGFEQIQGTLSAVISLSFVRLVTGTPSGPDDRGQSHYLMSMGADWRNPSGACPNNICTGVEVGKFIYPKVQWRISLMSTLTSDDLERLPLPPRELFQMPDGTYPTE